MDYTSMGRSVYRKGQFLFDALTIIGAIVAAHEMNALNGAHRCSEHLIKTDHDLIARCTVCGTELA